MLAPGRAKPKPTPETQHFWEGCKGGRLLLQRCGDTGKAYFPPLHSYVIHHRPVPGFTPPYAIAVVELEEGPRMMTNIVDCEQTPEALRLDMPLEVAFTPMDEEITLPLFRPVAPEARGSNSSGG